MYSQIHGQKKTGYLLPSKSYTKKDHYPKITVYNHYNKQ